MNKTVKLTEDVVITSHDCDRAGCKVAFVETVRMSAAAYFEKGLPGAKPQEDGTFLVCLTLAIHKEMVDLARRTI